MSGIPEMPTPPPRRRNPAVSIRRVQSERKYLTNWGGPPVFPTWKYKYDYARRTAIIPPMGQPHMIGTSQGVLRRGLMSGPIYPLPHSLSEAYLQPLILVAPPLIVGAYPPPRVDYPMPRRIPFTEDEILAQERINAFLKEVTPYHRPRSMLSYPESHLYESLISHISDEAKDISLDGSQENIYQKLTKGSKENSELSDSSTVEQKRSKVTQVDNPRSNIRERNVLSNLQLNENLRNEDIKTKKNIDLDVSVVQTSHITVAKDNLNTDLSKVSTKENQNAPEEKKKSSFLRNSFIYNIHKTCSKIYLKSFFKSKKKEDKEKKMTDGLHITPTTVSIVHINNDSGIDEVSVRESVCFKCDGSLSSRSRSDRGTSGNSSGTLGKRYTTPKKSLSLDFSKNIKLQRSSTFSSQSRDNLYFGGSAHSNFYRHTPVISRTVEIPESVPNKICFSNDHKTDKGVQVTSEDIARSQTDSDILTLDPLKPSTSTSDSGLVACSSCLNHKKRKGSRLSSLKNERNHKRMAKNSSSKPIQSSNLNDVSPLIVDFGSESDTNDTDIVKLHGPSRLHDKNRKNYVRSESSSSTGFKYGFNTNASQEALIYVYRSPVKSSTKSSCVFSTDDYKDDYYLKDFRKSFQNNLNRRGGSSGLGSSGSETSYDDGCHDDVNHSPSTKPSEPFLEASLGSSFGSSLSSLSSLKSTRARPCFDYSWSWSHLNDLVRKVPSLASSRRKTSPSLGSLRSPSSFKDVRSHFEVSSGSEYVAGI